MGRTSTICTSSINNPLSLCLNQRSSWEHSTHHDFGLLFKSSRCVGGDRAAKQAVKESPLMSWCKKPRINGQRMGKEQIPVAPEWTVTCKGAAFLSLHLLPLQLYLNYNTGTNESPVSPSHAKWAKSTRTTDLQNLSAGAGPEPQ